MLLNTSNMRKYNLVKVINDAKKKTLNMEKLTVSKAISHKKIHSNPVPQCNVLLIHNYAHYTYKQTYHE